MDFYRVKPLKTREISVRVPASKSILNRALLLSALTDGDTRLICNDYGEDTEALLSALVALGIRYEIQPDGLLVHGGKISPRATLDVAGAGTAARFLTAILAFRGGAYELRASAQMERRPMEIIPALRSLGATIECLKAEGHFPFRLTSSGVRAVKAEIGTDTSTQYASGLMLAAALGDAPFTVELTGSRTAGSYLKMTAELIRRFGGGCERVQDGFFITPIENAPDRFEVEPDLSGACYFYAISLLCGAKVLVEGVHENTLQGDIRFLRLLGSKGVRIKDTEEGIVADGTRLPFYNGIDEDMRDYADQTLTVAALAAFAESPSILRNVSHIRTQECDRVSAVLENLNALGAHAFTNGDDIFIEPAPLHPALIKTYDDHRVAMAFSLIGLRQEGVEIENPDCCKKTFPRYFDLLDKITE